MGTAGYKAWLAALQPGHTLSYTHTLWSAPGTPVVSGIQCWLVQDQAEHRKLKKNPVDTYMISELLLLIPTLM